MVATVGRIGHGVRFLRSTGNSPDDWEDIGQIAELGGPNMNRDAVDATHTRSTNRYREFVGGLRDAGEVSITLILAPGAGVLEDHKKILDDFNNDTAVTYRLVFPDDDETYFEMSALCTGMEHAEPIDDKMTIALTYKISGQPTLSEGAYLPA